MKVPVRPRVVEDSVGQFLWKTVTFRFRLRHRDCSSVVCALVQDEGRCISLGMFHRPWAD